MLKTEAIMTSFSKERWLKGMEGLRIVKNAVILPLEEHYKLTAKDWNDGDNHLQHLLDLAAKHYLKRNKKDSIWEVNCSECKPILEKIVNSHSRPGNLMWTNNYDESIDETDETPIECKLAKIYMPDGNKKIQSFKDCDPLTILEVCRNDNDFGLGSDASKYLILFRNRCVHSCDNCITEEELTDAFGTMKTFLKKFEQRTECIEAINKLDELQEKPMLCEIDESNEIWKDAISLQKMAKEKAGDINNEDLKELLEKTKVELKRQSDERDVIESKLTRAEQDLNTVQMQLQRSEENWVSETRRANSIRADLNIQIKKYENDKQGLQAEIQREREKHEVDEQRLQAEVERLQDELVKYNPSLAGRILKGAATGTGVGILGGPAGAAVGAAAGGAVGGASYFWDKITGK